MLTRNSLLYECILLPQYFPCRTKSKHSAHLSQENASQYVCRADYFAIQQGILVSYNYYIQRA